MGRPKKPKKTPKWQAGVDNMTPLYAMGVVPLVQPWGLIAAGVATITGAKLEKWEDYVALFVFCLIATGTYLAMEIYAAARPERTQAFLARVRGWIDTHTDQVIIVVSLVAGLLDLEERLRARHHRLSCQRVSTHPGVAPRVRR